RAVEEAPRQGDAGVRAAQPARDEAASPRRPARDQHLLAPRLAGELPARAARGGGPPRQVVQAAGARQAVQGPPDPTLDARDRVPPLRAARGRIVLRPTYMRPFGGPALTAGKARRRPRTGRTRSRSNAACGQGWASPLIEENGAH